MGIHHGTIVISANLDGQLKAALGLTPSMNIIDSNQSGRLGHQRPLPSLLHPKPLPRIFAGLLASLEPSTSRSDSLSGVIAGLSQGYGRTRTEEKKTTLSELAIRNLRSDKNFSHVWLTLPTLNSSSYPQPWERVFGLPSHFTR
ncbi:hypothetical protein PTTG_28541 [Puccinia triticina 1-1 BBBD Race 1]|uniref:Uncharacterized protein n=1 Tax=Puccinia triticina (isolate 1-1 / race 1 (BBBD)) TaxID=630390 RepID=A0A180GAS6_PUCT1|nr:hypothetical protein PTTG_28541 [Puccinia triticina 1-1 BBBD Race 1]